MAANYNTYRVYPNFKRGAALPWCIDLGDASHALDVEEVHVFGCDGESEVDYAAEEAIEPKCWIRYTAVWMVVVGNVAFICSSSNAALGLMNMQTQLVS